MRGQGAELPCGVWGNAPTAPRATNSKEVANKGAGSEASLPLTSRVRRRAPKLLIRPLAHCRAKWARPTSIERRFRCWSFSLQGISRLRTRQGGLSARTLDPFPCLTLSAARETNFPKKAKTHPDNPLVQERIAGMLAYHRITRTPLQMPQRTPGKTKYRTMQSCRSSP